MDKFMQWMHRYVQPVFLAMFVAAFIFWYIAKLSYTSVSYTHLRAHET